MAVAVAVAVAEQLPLGLWSADRPTDHATDHDAGVSIAHIGRAGGRDSARGDSHRPIDCRGGGVVGLARLELLGRVKTWRR